jgi:hypothetical protein
MNKDIIYIDVEDDITAIIGKVKDAKEKIVALVPPKRVGVLQSAVNLRLLVRASEQSGKRLVLITNNSSLMALAAAAKVPVAKTLQSKPELAEVAALDIDDGDDIIDGSQLPIGEHMTMAGAGSPDALVDDLIKEDGLSRATPPAPGQLPARPKSGIKVPNFNKFRKKLILIGAGCALLVAFLVWAIFFAPHATVAITARTSDLSVNNKITLDPAVTTSSSANTLKLTTAQTKKDASVDFDATGSKEVGTKAAGTMTITRSGVSDAPTTIPAGTQFTSGSIVLVSTAAATVPKSQIVGSSLDNGSTTVGVEAAAVGEEYNLSARSYQPSVSGFTAKGTDMAGGAKHKATVVSASDIQKATDQLTSQNTDAIKKQLADQLGSNVTVIDLTFKVTLSGTKSTPALNEEATGKAKLTTSITYTLSGVENSEIGRYLDEYFAKQIEGKANQRIYDNGAKKVTFTNIAVAEKDAFTGNIVASAKIGPKIDDNAIKEMAKGKRYGDIQASIESIDGVDNVDIKFSPFWVTTVPNDVKKISIEFKLNEQ